MNWVGVRSRASNESGRIRYYAVLCGKDPNQKDTRNLPAGDYWVLVKQPGKVFHDRVAYSACFPIRWTFHGPVPKGVPGRVVRISDKTVLFWNY